MRRSRTYLGWLLFAMIIFLPFGTLLFSCFGYQLELASVPVYTVATASIAAYLASISGRAKEPIEGAPAGAVCASLAPLSLGFALFCMIACRSVWVVVSVFVCAGCCMILTVKHGKPLTLKIIALVLSALMVLPIGSLGFLVIIFGGIGQNSGVKSVASPNGAYVARVIDSDQGAMGGDTLVDVYENKTINLILFKIFKKPQRVYDGDWGEFQNMEIYWSGDHCLVINAVPYVIE